MQSLRIELKALTALVITGLVFAACTGTAPTAAPTGASTPAATAATPAPRSAPSMTEEPGGHDGGPKIAFNAASATITVDGNASDWSAINGATVKLEQIRLANLAPADAAEIKFGRLDPVDVLLKVATDSKNIYVLVEVPGDFDYNASDHNLSASVAVMFRVDAPAEPHMGAEEPELDKGLGIVDMWHWELDCAPGAVSGGKGVSGGDDPKCNLDDEYSTKPENREDDGGGDAANPKAENSLSGVWDHTGRASGAGANGKWIFEFSRPLTTGDPQDAQFASGAVAHVALAFFDPDEGTDGWSDAGHLQSAYNGWIEVTLK